MDDNVTIILLNPGNPDFQLSLPLSSSVGTLKTRISQEHPLKPEPSRQRLLFSGRLLPDNDILRGLFNPQLVFSLSAFF